MNGSINVWVVFVVFHQQSLRYRSSSGLKVLWKYYSQVLPRSYKFSKSKAKSKQKMYLVRSLSRLTRGRHKASFATTPSTLNWGRTKGVIVLRKEKGLKKNISKDVVGIGKGGSSGGGRALRNKEEEQPKSLPIKGLEYFHANYGNLLVPTLFKFPSSSKTSSSSSSKVVHQGSGKIIIPKELHFYELGKFVKAVRQSASHWWT